MPRVLSGTTAIRILSLRILWRRILATEKGSRYGRAALLFREVMRGDFDEDEDPDFEPDEPDEPDEDDMCADCQRIGSHWDECGICGATMCSGCFEMGGGVCKGPHR